MTYSFTASAAKQFRKLPAAVQNEIVAKIRHFLNAKDPLYFAEPIIGEKRTYRFRIRDYRVIFIAERGHIVICKVGHRSKIYG
jgi:mRNA-degrading endonuclease RelE of RelBE toxin-antitoxin system